MKLTLTIDLPEDFKHLIEIFDFKPENIIQKFINEVSFPVFYSNLRGPHLWATYFFLDFVDEMEHNSHLFEPFLDRIAKSITKEQTKGEKAIRKIMTEWHRSVLQERSEALLRKFKDDNMDN